LGLILLIGGALMKQQPSNGEPTLAVCQFTYGLDDQKPVCVTMRFFDHIRQVSSQDAKKNP